MSEEQCSNQQFYLHVVRNPNGHSDSEVRTARLYIADALECALAEVNCIRVEVEKCRLENERLIAELEAIKQEKLASVDPLPGKEWSARAVCASAMADITDKTPIMILILDENQRTKHYSANLNNGIASWMLLYKINEILNP